MVCSPSHVDSTAMHGTRLALGLSQGPLALGRRSAGHVLRPVFSKVLFHRWMKQSVSGSQLCRTLHLALAKGPRHSLYACVNRCVSQRGPKGRPALVFHWPCSDLSSRFIGGTWVCMPCSVSGGRRGGHFEVNSGCPSWLDILLAQCSLI